MESDKPIYSTTERNGANTLTHRPEMPNLSNDHMAKLNTNIKPKVTNHIN